jgi:hypothetical protein
MYITTHPTQRNKNHEGKGESIKKLTMDQLGTRKGTNMDAHGGLKQCMEILNECNKDMDPKKKNKIKIE